jgi:hypothetical protein
MAEEEKGFTVKDRRSLDEKGDLRDERPEADKPKEAAKKAEKREGARSDEAQRIPLPEVSFNSLIFSLSSSALLHLGEIADPQTGEKKKDLSLAKHTIDTIGMLKEKTKGNLDEEERRFLESILTDLRWRYVKAAS